MLLIMGSLLWHQSVSNNLISQKPLKNKFAVGYNVPENSSDKSKNFLKHGKKDYAISHSADEGEIFSYLWRSYDTSLSKAAL